jgi:DNA-binding PadR family transcriptional regulator
MIDLQTLYRTLDQLPLDELIQIQQYIEQRRREKTQQTRAARITQLRAALDEFRAGTSEEEWSLIARAMNAEHLESDDSHLFGWLDDAPEDER